jgi:hypothetical protein
MPSVEEDKATIARLDTEYQAAVKRNDSATMERLLSDDFLLVTGSGKTYTRADLVKDAREGTTVYQHQEDTEQSVRVWGDSAVITAKLRESGTSNGTAFDKTLWFSDIYLRRGGKWIYVYAQSSIALPK